MTGWLVDTHALLWFWSEPGRLSEVAREVMDDDDARLVVSAATRIAIKTSLRTLRVLDAYPSMLEDDGFATLAILPPHAHAVARLPIDGHRDPFDRMLVAQAKVETMPLISRDERLDAYAIARLW